MEFLPDRAACYRAVSGRDPRFDGWIYVGVTSTGIYCRPSCPAQTPRETNCRFFAAPGAAQQAGFRACRRCHPDAVPGSPQWNLRADVVGRAMRLITDGVVDRLGVSGLAATLGYSERQLNRLLIAEVGASPIALARAQRAHAARLLIEASAMPMADIAFAAGFSSIRQFNDTVRLVFGCSPTLLRRNANRSARSARRQSDPDRGAPAGLPGTLHLKLPVRRPFHADALFDFLGHRAVAGLESYQPRQAYNRSLSLPHGPGAVRLAWTSDDLRADLQLSDLRDLGPAVNRVRGICDLDADPIAVDEALGHDDQLGQLITASPGLRIPGSPDSGELAIRALIGQQVSLAGATTCTARLVARYGQPLPATLELPDLRTFPAMETLAEVDPGELPMPRARGRALVGLAAALASGHLDLGPGCDRAAARTSLLALPGIGPWTAGYLAMRGLGDSDVLLDTDLVIRRQLGRLGVTSGTAWAPWRSYATIHLWRAAALPAPATALMKGPST